MSFSEFTTIKTASRSQLLLRSGLCGVLASLAVAAPAALAQSVTGVGTITNYQDNAGTNTTTPGAPGGPVTTGGGSTDITLRGSRTLIDWSSLSVTTAEGATFQFAERDWIVLNRVGAGSASINGALNGVCASTCVGGAGVGGNIWVYARDGVVIGATGSISSGGFLATTSPISNPADFLNDANYNFTFGASNGAAVTVVSGADVSVHGGALALIAPRVDVQAGATLGGDTGSVGAPGKSDVLFGGATSYNLTFAPSSTATDDFELVSFEIPNSAAGSGDTLPIRILGTVQGNNVYLASASKVAASQMLVGGTVTAVTASSQGGDIVISAVGGINAGAAATAVSGATAQTLALSGALDADGAVSLKTAGAISQTGGTITANVLNASADTGIALNQANAVTSLGAISNSTTGGVSYTDADSFALTGAVTAAGQTVSLTSTTGAISQSGGVITANVLTASADTGVTLNQANAVTSLGAISNGTSGGVSYTDADSFDLTGNVTAGGQTVSLTSTAGTISQSGGIITANVLTASADTGIALGQANAVTSLGAISNGTSGGVTYADTDSFDLTGNVTAGGQTVSLTSDAGAITQSGGIITADTLTASADTGITLDQANAVTSLGAISNGTSGGVTYADADDIDLTGSVTAAGQIVSLTSDAGAITQSGGIISADTLTASASTGVTLDQANTVTSLGAISNGTSGGVTYADADDIDLTGSVTAAGQTVSLTSDAGAISQSGGVITANLLTASADTGVSLNQANAVSSLGALSSNSGGVGYTDTDGFNLTGAVTATGQGVDLVSNTGAIGQTAGGTITAGALTVSAATGVALNQANNVVSLGAISNTGSGGVIYTDADSFALTGSIAAAGQTVSLTSTAGGISQTGGAISANILSASADTGIALNRANDVASLGAFSNGTSGGIGYTDINGFALTGLVSAGGQTVSLTSTTGAISQTGGTITAGALIASAATGIALNRANDVASLGAISNSTSGGVSYTDTDSFTLTGNVAAAGQTVALTSTTGAINQSGGIITADTLTASAVTGIALNRANNVASLGAISNSTSGGVTYTDTNDFALTGAVTAAGQAVGLTSTTGAISQQVAGIITADSLTASANTGIALNRANNVASLGTLSSGSGNIGYTDTDSFALTGAITAAGQTVGLTSSTGSITQSGGAITANVLTATAAGSITLDQANQVSALSNATAGDDLTFVNVTGFTAGADTATTGVLSLTAVTGALTAGGLTGGGGVELAGGSIVLNGDIAGPSLDLTSGGTITQTAGEILTSTLSGQSVGGVTLTGGDFDVLQDFSNLNSGAIAITNATGFEVRGVIANTGGTSGGAGRDITLTATTGDITGSGRYEAVRDVSITALAGSAFAAAVDAQGDLTLGGQVDAGLGEAGAPDTEIGGQATITADTGQVRLAGSITSDDLMRVTATVGSVSGADADLTSSTSSVVVRAGGAVSLASADASVDADVAGVAGVDIGAVTAGRDVAVRSTGGAVELGSAEALDDIVLRGQTGVTVGAGGLTTTGTVAGVVPAEAGDALFATGPSALNGALDVGASTIDVASAAGAIRVDGAVDAAGGDARFQTGAGGGAVTLANVTASRDILVDGTLVAAGALSTGSSGRDIAVRARSGTATLASASAGDDIVLRAAGDLTVTGALTSGAGVDAAGLGDRLIAPAESGPLTAFGQTFALLTGGDTDIVAGKATVQGTTRAGRGAGASLNDSDVRVQAAGGVALDDVFAGRDILVDGGAFATGADLDALRDIGLRASVGAAHVGSALAGDDIVLRGRTGVTVTGALTATGLAAAGTDQAGDLLFATAPSFLVADLTLAASDVDVGSAAGNITVGGPVQAASAQGAARFQTDKLTGGSVQLSGAVTAAEHILVDGTTVASAALHADGDIAARARTGDLTLASAWAGDDVVLRADGQVHVTGRIDAGAGPDTAGLGDALIDAAESGPLVVEGSSFASLTGGDIDVGGGSILLDGPAVAAKGSVQNDNDVRIMSGGSAILADATAGRDILVDAADVAAGTLDAYRDVGVRGAAGSVVLASATAGDDVVLRGRTDVTVTGGLDTTGATVTAGADEAGDILFAADPTHIVADLDLTGANVDVRTATGDIAVTGATTVAGAAGHDARFQTDKTTGGEIGVGAVTAVRDVLVDGAGATTSVLTADTGDVAVRARSGDARVASAFAGDDIVIRASGEAATGRLDSALGANASGLGDGLTAATESGQATVGAASFALLGGDVDIVAGKVTAGGAITAARGAVQNDNDVRIVASGPATLTDVTAGRDILIDATQVEAGALDAHRDIGVRAKAGAVILASASAGDDVVLRGQAGVRVTGGLDATGGTVTAATDEAGDILFAADPTVLVAALNLDGANVDVRATTGDIAVGGATTVAGAAGRDARFQTDKPAGGAVQLSGAVTAARHILVDGTAVTTAALHADGDIAARARTGDLTLGSAWAGDDVALRADGQVHVTGRIDAGAGSDTAGLGDALIDATESGPLVVKTTSFASLAGGDIDVGGGSVRLDGAAVAAKGTVQNDNDVRVVSRGTATLADATAGRDILVDATGVAAGALDAQRDVGVQARAGTLVLASAAAGDDIALTASDKITVAGGLSATGTENADTGAAAASHAGDLLFGSLTPDTAGASGHFISIRAADLDLTSTTDIVRAGVIRIEAAKGGLALGGTVTGSATTMGISDQEFGRLRAGTVLLFAGDRSGTARGDLTVADLNVVGGAAGVGTLALHAGAANTVKVSGSILPSGGAADGSGQAVVVIGGTPAVTGGQAGTAGGWSPKRIEVTGRIGDSGKAFGAVRLTAVDRIMIGSAAFIAAVDAKTDAQLVKGATAPDQTLGREVDKTYLAASQVSFRANGRIMQQNTSALQGRYGGVLITNPSPRDPAPLQIGRYDTGVTTLSPAVVDLFASLTDASGNVLTDSQAAPSTSILLLDSLARNNAYRINSCVIGAAANCLPSGSVSFEITPDRLIQGLIVETDDPEEDRDPTVTGAGNEEIWRKS